MAKTFEAAKQDLLLNPERHMHPDLDRLTSCCTINDRLHMELLEEHDRLKRAMLDR